MSMYPVAQNRLLLVDREAFFFNNRRLDSFLIVI